MAADGMQTASGDDFQVHKRNYDGFLTILKWSSVVVAIIAAIVIFIISR